LSIRKLLIGPPCFNNFCERERKREREREREREIKQIEKEKEMVNACLSLSPMLLK